MVHSAFSLEESGHAPGHRKCSLRPYTARILSLRDVTFTASLGGGALPLKNAFLTGVKSIFMNEFNSLMKLHNEVKTVKT